MTKQIKIHKDQQSGEQFFKLEDFQDFFDIKDIEFYELTLINNKLILTFYDKDKNQLKPISK